ncbi:hypothetical protein EJB05_20214, partial [Eragrostis curvula]
MSSEPPPASAMGADLEPALPSLPRSKKRTSRAGDGQSSPNPSPGGSPAGTSDLKRRRRTSAESAALALAEVAADADRAAVKGRRPAGVRVDEGDGAIQMLGAAAARVTRSRVPVQKYGPAYVDRGAAKRHWSDADELTLLNAAMAFRDRTGHAPRLPDMEEFFEFHFPEIDQWQVYYKLKRLKSKYQHTGGPSDRRMRDLCANLWGLVPPLEDNSDGQEAGDTDADERRAAPDAAAMMPVVTEVLGEYWKTNAPAMGNVPLEKGLSRLGKKQGRLMENKWRQQLDEEMQTQMRRHDLAKEVCALLSGAIKANKASRHHYRHRTTRLAAAARFRPDIVKPDTPTLQSETVRLAPRRAPMPSASTAEANAAPTRPSSPRWKKPASGPLPCSGDGNQGLNPSLCGPPSSRSELKRRLRASAEAAALALTAAEAARGSRASVSVEGGVDGVQKPIPAGVLVDGGFDDVQRPGPAGVRGTVPRLWSGADEVTLLAAAAAFRKRTGRAPRRHDAGALFHEIESSISPDIDVGKAYDRLDGFKREFLHGALRGSDDPHDCRVRDLCADVWGAVDVVSPPGDGSDGDEAGEQDADEERLVAGDGENDDDRRRLAAERTPKPAPLPRLDAQLTSEGPSASAMDTDVVPKLPSPSRSMKRSSHPQPSVDDGHPGRIPSLRRLGTSTDHAALAHAAAAAARGSDDIAAHVDEEQNDHRTDGVPVDVGHGTTQRLEPAVDEGHDAGRNSHKAWSEADEITVLNAAVAFRERTGRVPRVTNAGDARVLFRSIRGSVSPHIDQARASYKLCRFRRMFRHEAPGESATAHDHRVHDLSAKVWGVVAGNEGTAIPLAREKEGLTMPLVTEVLGEFWKVNKRAMAGLPLEKGLSLLGKREAMRIETKWRRQLDEELRTRMQGHELEKEICGLLRDTIMDFGP